MKQDKSREQKNPNFQKPQAPAVGPTHPRHPAVNPTPGKKPLGGC